MSDRPLCGGWGWACLELTCRLLLLLRFFYEASVVVVCNEAYILLLVDRISAGTCQLHAVLWLIGLERISWKESPKKCEERRRRSQLLESSNTLEGHTNTKELIL